MKTRVDHKDCSKYQKRDYCVLLHEVYIKPNSREKRLNVSEEQLRNEKQQELKQQYMSVKVDKVPRTPNQCATEFSMRKHKWKKKVHLTYV